MTLVVDTEFDEIVGQVLEDMGVYYKVLARGGETVRLPRIDVINGIYKLVDVPSN